MKYIVNAKILRQESISSDVRLLEVEAPSIAQTAQPGQFVNVEITKLFEECYGKQNYCGQLPGF